MKVRTDQKAFYTFGTVTGRYLDGQLLTREGTISVKSKKSYENGCLYTLKGKIYANKETGRTSITVY